MFILSQLACVLSEWPVSLKDGPEGEGRCEDAEEEVGEGEGDDEGVARVRPQLGRRQDDGLHGRAGMGTNSMEKIWPKVWNEHRLDRIH